MTAPDMTEAATTASKLAAMRAKTAPLSERLGKVEAAIADHSEATSQGGSLDDQIKARKVAASKVAELHVERDVICQRLEPLLAEIAELERADKAERAAADRQRSITSAREALARVSKAREALNAEIAAMEEVGKTTPIRWSMMPEVHFAVQEELGQLQVTMRLLGAAAV